MKKTKSLNDKDKLLKLMIYGFLVVTFILLNLYCFQMFVDADTLFPHRYLSALLSDHPSLLIIHPGPRMFPEWAYSWLVMSITTQVELWSDVMLFINCSMLTVGLWYCLKQIRQNDANQVGYLLIVALAVIPVLGLLHNNYLHYYIFMHGMHAFLLPYVFFCFGFCIKHLLQPQTSWVVGVLLLFVLTLLVVSNQLIILMLVGPIVGVLLWLLITGFADKKKLIYSIGCLLASTVLGLVLAFAFKQFSPTILLMQNNYTFFDQGLLSWLSDNRTFNHLLDRQRSGYILEIILFAFALAVFSLIRFRKKPHEPFYLMMLFFVVSFIGFIVVIWLTNKNHIRYMPHLIFLAPIIILSVFNKIKLIKSFAPIAALMFFSLLLTLGMDSEPSLNEKKQFKAGLSEINIELSNIKKQFVLKGDGLSDYWFSHSFINESFQVLPVTKGIQKDKINPVTWAINLNEYWLYENQLKVPRVFNFVVNYKFSDKPKWVINERVMLKSFGTYDEVVRFSKGIYDYQVYIYFEGVQATIFYADLEQQLAAIKQYN